MKVLERKFERNNTKTDYKKVVLFYDLWSRFTKSKTAKYVMKFAEIKDGTTILEVAC